ncbi:MAG: hypothetical protein AB1861_25290 [Cyanobacteriota bacterium]
MGLYQGNRPLVFIQPVNFQERSRNFILASCPTGFSGTVEKPSAEFICHDWIQNA